MTLYCSFSPDLSVRNILDRLRAVCFSSANWRELGQRLTPTADLDAIEKDHQTSESRMGKVVDEWKRNGDQPSWKTLAEAVSLCSGGGQHVKTHLLREVGIGMLGSSPVNCFSLKAGWSQNKHSKMIRHAFRLKCGGQYKILQCDSLVTALTRSFSSTSQSVQSFSNCIILHRNTHAHVYTFNWFLLHMLDKNMFYIHT